MCAMISGLFIGSNDGRPPQAYKENIVSLSRNTFEGRVHQPAPVLVHVDAILGVS